MANREVRTIVQRLSLRSPQATSLEILADVLDIIELRKVAGQPGGSTSQYSAMLRSKQSFEIWLRAEVAGDQFGKTQMAMTGQAQLIPNGTLVLVTDVDSLNIGEVIPISQVRILDGKYAGAAGWMAAKSVLKRP